MNVSKCDLSVIVPAYKQEKTIAGDLENISEILKKIGCKFELICVVDGLEDNTFGKASNYAKKNSKVLLLCSHTNRGKGHAVRLGINKAKGEYIIFIDSGGDIDPKGIKIVFDKLVNQKQDVVVGSKYLPDSIVHYAPLRKLYSQSFRLLVRLLFNLKISDSQVGLKGFSKKVIRSVLDKLVIDGFAFDVEILAVIRRVPGIKIAEVPIVVRKVDATNSMAAPNLVMKNAWKMYIDTLRIYRNLHFTSKYI
jgi:glycosyltransferase involved in cell wall biosynthesis